MSNNDQKILNSIVEYLNNKENEENEENKENYKKLIDIFFESDKDNSMKIEKKELINIQKKFNLKNTDDTINLLNLISKNEGKYKKKSFFDLNDIIELGCIININDNENFEFNELAKYLNDNNLLEKIKDAAESLYNNIQNYIKEKKLIIYFKNPKFNILENFFLEEIHTAINNTSENSIEYDKLIKNLENLENMEKTSSTKRLGLSKILRALI